ncbi:MAG: PD40 domain-containing protein [Herpetosiphonaceae bacterium]|nr:PD40 domain-containing protein [Herpetosiphonaceae bacterium]
MVSRLSWRRVLGTALAGIVMTVGTMPTHAAPWADRFSFAMPAFQTVWQASDSAVANGQVARSYTWGPAPWFDYKEYYRQAPNGLRQVQYFDKARMEINNPSLTGPRAVTNGLLTVEMVAGRIKLGDGIDFEDNLQRQPADVPVAGDPANVNGAAPTYASFKGVATVDNSYRDPDKTGQQIGTTLDKLGNRAQNAALAADKLTKIVAYNTVTGHNMPQVFRDFIQNGPVDGLFAFGYPITDPYWVQGQVGGASKTIFVQLYERRVVTYTPSNPAAYRVEMGNVGQHYFQWRYPHLGQPWLTTGQPDAPIAFASKRASSDHWESFAMNTDGSDVRQLTSGTSETVPYSLRRAFTGGADQRLLVDSTRDGGHRQLFSIDLSNPSDVRQHTADQYGGTFAFNPAISPDGTQIAAAVQRGNITSMSIVPFATDRAYTPPQAPEQQNCNYQSPTWLPDGTGLVFAANCNGKFAIYRADVQYNYAPSDSYIAASIVNIRALTNTPNVDNYFPRVSPDGKEIAFTSDRNGAGDVYLMKLDGTGERRLTADLADDAAPTWSPDGTQLAFQSNRDGDYEIYKLDNKSLSVTQLTFNSVDDQWPIWAQ